MRTIKNLKVHCFLLFINNFTIGILIDLGKRSQNQQRSVFGVLTNANKEDSSKFKKTFGKTLNLYNESSSNITNIKKISLKSLSPTLRPRRVVHEPSNINKS
jgi:hypothetical protein